MPQRSTRGTNKISSWCLLCLFVAGLISCRDQSSSAFTVVTEIAPQPPRVGQVTITLQVTDTSGKTVSGARIKLEGNMSHAGMVPVFADAAEVEPNRYRANMELTMAGDWVIVVHLTLPDGAKVERQFGITVLNT